MQHIWYILSKITAVLQALHIPPPRLLHLGGSILVALRRVEGMEFCQYTLRQMSQSTSSNLPTSPNYHH